MKALLKALLPLFFLNNLTLAESVDLSQHFFGANLGQGVHSSEQVLTPFSCISIDDSSVIKSSNFLMKSDYMEIETFEEVKKLTKSGLKISKIFQAKLQKSLTHSKKDKVIKMTLSFIQMQEGKSVIQFKENFEFLARNGLFVEFAHACGTHYLSSIAKGHKLHIFMIVSSAKEQSMKDFEATLNLKLNELISTVSGTEQVEQVLGKLELTASMLKKLESLNQEVQLEYTIAMTSAASSSNQTRLLMPSEVAINTGISNQVSETGNNLTKLLLTLTKSFPEFALNEFKNNINGLPQIEGMSESYINLLSTHFMGDEIFQLSIDNLQIFLESNKQFHFFINAFEKLESRNEKLEILIAKAIKVQNTTKLKFKRKKILNAILKFLKVNLISAKNIQKFCASSSLVYSDCYALAFGKAPGSKFVTNKFIQAGSDFTCLESIDIPAIQNCLDQGMGPKSCKKIEFSTFNLETNHCEESHIDFLTDFVLPIQPKVF